jgi:hypothetical protein
MFHGLKSIVRPEKVTGRTAAQIVKEAEAGWLKPHLIGIDTPIIANNAEHLAACRCNACFQKKLDELVTNSGKSLESLQNS